MPTPADQHDPQSPQIAVDTRKAPISPLPPLLATQRTGPRAIFQALDRNANYPYVRSDYIKRIGWKIVEKTLFRYSSPRARKFRVRLARLFGAKLAITVNLRPTCTIMHPWLLEMGDYACLGDGVTVYNLGPVAIGGHTTISQNCHLCAGTHDHTDPAMPLIRSAIRIGSGCWVCADSFVGPEVSIGDNTIIAARSVVTRSIGPDLIAAGNPAKPLKTRPMEEPKRPPT